MSLGPIGVASSSNSVSSANAQQSLSFNPNIVIGSPESQLRNLEGSTGGISSSPYVEGSSSARADATMPGFGGGDRSGLLDPLKALASNLGSSFRGGGPTNDPDVYALRSEVGGKGSVLGSMGGGASTTLLIVGGIVALGAIAYFTMK